MKAHHLNIFFIFVFGALGGLLFGFDTGIISGASSLIESDFSLNIEQTGFITSSVLIDHRLGPCLLVLYPTSSVVKNC